MLKILITGSGGQLGQCLKEIEKNYPYLNIYFADSKELDVTKKTKIKNVFSKTAFDFVVNCAAYTNVEQAEKEPEKAFNVNAIGVKNLAEVCKEYNATLIHISTDYVFDGQKRTPYTEEDDTNPINEYGKSKLAGENYIQAILEKYFIIRTSWLYSKHGHNFFKTILKKLETEKEITITSSETGTPTNANDLARFIFELIDLNVSKYGIYHFSNQGECTWYDFAKEILIIRGKNGTIKLGKTDNYPTFAVRPKYSVLNKKNTFKILKYSVLDWKKSLKEIMK